MARTCKECGSMMTMVESMNSSNAIIETWQCKSCNEREQICTGLKL